MSRGISRSSSSLSWCSCTSVALALACWMGLVAEVNVRHSASSAGTESSSLVRLTSKSSKADWTAAEQRCTEVKVEYSRKHRLTSSDSIVEDSLEIRLGSRRRSSRGKETRWSR
jgi:hypothetical protein